jgi:hypothetical protein
LFPQLKSKLLEERMRQDELMAQYVRQVQYVQHTKTVHVPAKCSGGSATPPLPAQSLQAAVKSGKTVPTRSGSRSPTRGMATRALPPQRSGRKPTVFTRPLSPVRRISPRPPVDEYDAERVQRELEEDPWTEEFLYRPDVSSEPVTEGAGTMEDVARMTHSLPPWLQPSVTHSPRDSGSHAGKRYYAQANSYSNGPGYSSANYRLSQHQLVQAQQPSGQKWFF